METHWQGWLPPGGPCSSLGEHGLGFAVQVNTLPTGLGVGLLITNSDRKSPLFQIMLPCNLNGGVAGPERGWGWGLDFLKSEYLPYLRRSCY